MWPNRANTSATISSTWPLSETSEKRPIDCRPSASISRTTLGSPSHPSSRSSGRMASKDWGMSVTTTSAPSRASRVAMERPMPCRPPAPVTIATLPLRSYILHPSFPAILFGVPIFARRLSWYFGVFAKCRHQRLLLSPLILSLSKDVPPDRGAWFDRLTMSGFCSWRRFYIYPAQPPLALLGIVRRRGGFLNRPSSRAGIGQTGRQPFLKIAGRAGYKPAPTGCQGILSLPLPGLAGQGNQGRAADVAFSGGSGHQHVALHQVLPVILAGVGNRGGNQQGLVVGHRLAEH